MTSACNTAAVLKLATLDAGLKRTPPTHVVENKAHLVNHARSALSSRALQCMLSCALVPDSVAEYVLGKLVSSEKGFKASLER